MKSRCIFATHYHELTKLNAECPGFVNMHVAIQEDRGEIRFLRILQEGEIGKSYGIQCARLAGLPRTVIRRASQLLRDLEMEQAKRNDGQLSLFGDDFTPLPYLNVDKTEEIEQRDQPHTAVELAPDIKDVLDGLKTINLNDYSPFEALQELYAIQKKIQAVPSILIGE